MPFTVIRGHFFVQGKQPDGDSIRFKANDETLILGLRRARSDPHGLYQLRFEAVDALEIHYNQGARQIDHQPNPMSKAARDFVLSQVGIKVTTWSGQNGEIASAVANDGAEGYILANSFEENGRPVSFVYAGKPPEADGTLVRLDPARLRKSINFELAHKGLVFPTYYDSFYADLRAEISHAVGQARKTAGKDSVWAKDATNEGVAISTLQSAVAQLVVDGGVAFMPKLFRRVSTFFREHPDATLTHDRLQSYLAQHPDPVQRIGMHVQELRDFLEVHNGKLRLTVPPEDLMFRPNAVVSHARVRAAAIAEANRSTATNPVATNSF